MRLALTNTIKLINRANNKINPNTVVYICERCKSPVTLGETCNCRKRKKNDKYKKSNHKR